MKGRELRDPCTRYRRAKKKKSFEIDNDTGVGEVSLRVSQWICTFIAYELQFRDGSGLIQFNGAPGELYARRHLVARSSYKYTYICVRVRGYASL